MVKINKKEEEMSKLKLSKLFKMEIKNVKGGMRKVEVEIGCFGPADGSCGCVCAPDFDSLK